MAPTNGDEPRQLRAAAPKSRNTKMRYKWKEGAKIRRTKETQDNTVLYRSKTYENSFTLINKEFKTLTFQGSLLTEKGK